MIFSREGSAYKTGNQIAMHRQDAPLLSISDDGMSIFPWRPVHVLIHHMISNLQSNCELLLYRVKQGTC